ncbi:uncharacterized protein LOC116340401 isoform X2 [Contarinia nasturtii]|uniref:uncharacterized protein LOC116340401 isoform X2 n=1 Tax=Contarinia nasturtii TaxID=265458 RepID=UPI0012D3793A|nr:uncharacterized protein LOC116340401 isoform X2 [Contarinia nasturtii]
MKNFLIMTIAFCFISNISNSPISSTSLENSEKAATSSSEGVEERPKKLAKISSIADKGKAALEISSEFALGCPVFPAPAKLAIGTAKSAVDGTKALYRTKSLDEALRASIGPVKTTVSTGTDFALFNPAVPASVKIAAGTGRALLDGTQAYRKTKSFKETGKAIVGSSIDSANKALLPAYYGYTRSGYNLMNDICEGKDLKSSIKQRAMDASWAFPIKMEYKIGADLTRFLFKKMMPDIPENEKEYIDRNSEEDNSKMPELDETESDSKNDDKSDSTHDEGSSLKLSSKDSSSKKKSRE